MHREIRSLVNNQLFFLKNRQHTFWGSISEAEEKELIDLTSKASAFPGPIVEIGALFGFTTQLLATYKPADKELIAVENFTWNPFGIPPEDHRLITRRVLRYNVVHCNTSVFDGSKRDFYSGYKGERPAMVFMDADHSYEGTKEDIAWAIKAGARIIAGHDYSEIFPGVKRSVDEAFKANIRTAGSVWHHCNL
jgi:predicted O-methyltransferase YrrM